MTATICRKQEIKAKRLELTSTSTHFSRLIYFTKCKEHPEFDNKCNDCQNMTLAKHFTDVYGCPEEPVLITGKKAKKELDHFIDQKIDKALVWKVPKKNNPMIGVHYHNCGNMIRLDDTIKGKAETRIVLWVRGVKFICYKDYLRIKAFKDFVSGHV